MAAENEKRAKGKKIFHKYEGYMYILPWLIGFFVFQMFPLLYSLFYSFTDYSIGSAFSFVGLKNYKYAFQIDSNFKKSLAVTFIYVFTAVPAKLVMAMLMALVLNMKLKFVNAFRTAFYIPSIMGASVAVSILWRFLFMKEGYINNFLSMLGIGPVDWTGDKRYALFTIALITIWQFGSSMILYLNGLKQVPESYYEAAKIDGANPFQRFFSITIPQLSPIIFFTVIMQVITAFQEFTAPMLITSGGPVKSTYLYGLMLYENAFKFYKMGYASALSWILFIIIVIFSLLMFRYSNAKVYYEDGGK